MGAINEVHILLWYVYTHTLNGLEKYSNLKWLTSTKSKKVKKIFLSYYVKVKIYI